MFHVEQRLSVEMLIIAGTCVETGIAYLIPGINEGGRRPAAGSSVKKLLVRRRRLPETGGKKACKSVRYSEKIEKTCYLEIGNNW